MHYSTKALNRLIEFVGASRGSKTWCRKTGISRIAHSLDLQAETIRRYADGKKGYEKGVPLRTFEKLIISFGILAFVN